MFSKKQWTRNDILLVLANLVPVIGVWFFGWGPTDAFIVYALETIIIGLITILKLTIMTIVRKKDLWYNGGAATLVSGRVFIFFFIVHYGFFVVLQMTMFSQSAGIVPGDKGLFYFFLHWFKYINSDVAIMLGVFFISNLLRTFIPFILSGEYKTVSMTRVMFQPYGRIFIQQFTVILGSMFLAFGWGKAFVLIFALAKIFFEVYLNLDHIIDKATESLDRGESNTTTNK